MVGGTPTSCRIDFMSSNINSNAFCNYTNGTAGAIPLNHSIVTIYDAFTSSSSEYWATDIAGNPASKEITFFINTIINPTSTKPASLWYVNTKNYLETPATGVPSYYVD
jgi:hypothetical protein